MLFDIHTHIFPDRLARKALDSLSATIHEPYYADGTLSGTLSALSVWNVTNAAVMQIAATPHQQHSVNDFAASIRSDTLFCFGSIHPDAEDAVQEVGRICELGLCGIKLHPDYQNISVLSKSLFPVYEEAAARNLPVLFHTGFDPVSPKLLHAPSKDILRVTELFPTLTVIAAHMGGMMTPDEAEEYILGRNIWIDTAMAPYFLSPKRFSSMVKKHGAEHVLFGSDCPWSRSSDIFRFIEQTDLTDTEKENIYSRNAQFLFRIKA